MKPFLPGGPKGRPPNQSNVTKRKPFDFEKAPSQEPMTELHIGQGKFPAQRVVAFSTILQGGVSPERQGMIGADSQAKVIIQGKRIPRDPPPAEKSPGWFEVFLSATS